MSSLRNAVKRITHKERSQPLSRSHLGILEKKKDYRLRSSDYKSKQDKLKQMRIKASNRNPDEYYMAMNSSKVDGMSGNNSGKHLKTDERRRKDLEEKGLGDEAVRIMKDQDLSYVRMQRMMDDKKIEKLQSSLHYLDSDGVTGGKKRKHTVFIEGDVEDFDAAKHFDTLPELVGRAFNRPRVETLEKEAMKKLGKKVTASDLNDPYYQDDSDEESNIKPLNEKHLKRAKKQRKHLERRIASARSAAYSEMELRNIRMQKLKAAEDALVVEKQTQMKGRRRKIVSKDEGGGKVDQYKWRRKRAK
jgi:U3 small nucleolar RNA-associated protein 11